MKKILEWTKKPVTWGGMFKWRILSYLLASVIYVIFMAYMFRDSIKSAISKKFGKDEPVEEN